jgi:hypothetical protein
MSGPYPRSWGVGADEDVEDLGLALLRVWDALDGEDWDHVELVVNPMLDALWRAGYIAQWGGSPMGCFWEITSDGHERLRELGRPA